ncbi:MAG: hypothetical protein GY866_31405 [Proteobacteria bacterium]|nr:hypothetical protein [Pseudomonadota bacterium]
MAVGFVSILSQVLILRELSVAFYGIELIYILAMGIWLFWTALGALAGRRNYMPRLSTVRNLFFVFSLLLPLEVAFIRGTRILFGGITGSFLPFELQLTALVAALLPVGILLGLLFQWMAKLYVAESKTLAVAYALESAGGLGGGLTATLLVKFGIQNYSGVVLCSLLAAAVPLLMVRERRDPVLRKGIAVVSILLPVAWFSTGMDQGQTRWNHPNLVESRDSPYGRITISGQKGQTIVFENDALTFETESVTPEELVHLAAIHHDHPQDILILGGGIEGLLREILKHSPRKVDYVELNPLLLDLTRKHLPASYQSPLASGTVEIHRTDPRAFLRDSQSYDLILSGYSEPADGLSNRFFTQDFYQLCLNRLKPKGILSFRLRSSENIWTKFVAYRNTSIYLALKAVFDDVLVLPGVSNTIIASNKPLSRDPKTLAARFESRNVATKLVSQPYIRYLYTNDRFFGILKQLTSTMASPNTDNQPICYQFSSLIWLSKFFPGMIHWNVSSIGDLSDRGFGIGISIVLVLGGFFFWVRLRTRYQRTTLMAVVGFIGMVLETMLILHYQVKNGVLFQNLGILLMGFMAGLTAGSYFVRQTTQKSLDTQDLIGKSTGRWLLVGFSLLNLVFIALLRSNYSSGLFVITLMQFATGFLVAGVFAYASLANVADQRSVVSPLYAADLLGGCLASLLGTLFLIPFLGMEHSTVLMTVLALVAMVLV